MIYLDNAATTYKKPHEVYATLVEVMVNNGVNAGRGGYDAAVRANEILLDAKEALASLFHIDNPERIAFTYNTTGALNMGIKGVLSYGDHVIITSMEHNSVLRPVKSCAIDKRTSYSVLQANKKGEIDVNSLEMLIRPNTKLICMTHSSNVCGTLTDIYRAAEIAHKHNILFMVDAAQSAGIIDIDCSNLDLMAFPGHKGIMGPMGTGGLYVRDGLTLKTIIEGGTGSFSESVYQPDIMPDRLESGTLNLPGIAGLGEAAKFLLKTGVDNIRSHEKALCSRFDECVREMPGVTVYGSDNKTAVSALNIDGIDCVNAAHLLNDRYDIAVRAGLHCAVLAHKTLGTEKKGCIRFSFGYFNTMSEVDKAIDAVYNLSTEARRL